MGSMVERLGDANNQYVLHDAWTARNITNKSVRNKIGMFFVEFINSDIFSLFAGLCSEKGSNSPFSELWDMDVTVCGFTNK